MKTATAAEAAYAFRRTERRALKYSYLVVLLPDNNLPSSRYQSAILDQMAALAASWQHNTG